MMNFTSSAKKTTCWIYKNLNIQWSSMKTISVQLEHHMKGCSFFWGQNWCSVLFVGYLWAKPAKPEIQPLNKVSVFEDVEGFCVLTKSWSFLSQPSQKSVICPQFVKPGPMVFLQEGLVLQTGSQSEVWRTCGLQHRVCLLIVYLYVNKDSRSSWFVLSFLQPAVFDCTYWTCRKWTHSCLLKVHS